MKPDAREQYRPDRAYAVQLIDAAQRAVGSRNKLCKLAGISRRRLGYVEAGYRQTERGMLKVVISFAEQVILEDIARGETQP